MAAGMLPLPGTEYGPCVSACEHRDCAATRTTAESVCPLCGDPIGYETRYYVLSWDAVVEGEDPAPVHGVCVD